MTQTDHQDCVDKAAIPVVILLSFMVAAICFGILAKCAQIERRLVALENKK